MPRLTLALVALPLWPVLAGVTPSAQRSAVMPTLAEPSISPDRAEIAFVSGGDIWTVPAQGGEARLLVAHAANDTRPNYSPDGSRLAFVSNRTGNGDIYVLDLRRGTLMRVTFDDLPEQLDNWSRDGEWLYFSSTSRDIAGMHDVYRVRATGGTPMRVAGDRYASEFWSAPSPDGQTLAIAARGVAVGQWWRKGHSHIDASELHLVRMGETPAYTRVSDGRREAKEMWPMWAPDGRALYYVSDREGSENLWVRPSGGGAARRLTSTCLLLLIEGAPDITADRHHVRH